MTLTYNPSLAKVKVNPHAKNQGQRSNGSNRRAPTDKRTDTHTHGRYQTYYLPCYAVDNAVQHVKNSLQTTDSKWPWWWRQHLHRGRAEIESCSSDRNDRRCVAAYSRPDNRHIHTKHSPKLCEMHVKSNSQSINQYSFIMAWQNAG